MAAASSGGRRARHRAELAALGPKPDAIRDYLGEHSNLPGPRGNLELAHAFADWAPDPLVDALAAESDEYLLFCALLALGERLARADDPALVVALQEHARDSRWRIREAVATGLQRLGDRDLPRLCALVTEWVATEDPLVKRAAAAAICEPRLLACELGSDTARAVCAAATSWIEGLPAAARRDSDVRVLRQALGYCWSVALAAAPEPGLAALAELSGSPDPDVIWIVRENRRKRRLAVLLDD